MSRSVPWKILLVLLVVLVLLSGGTLLFQKQIGLILAKRVIDRTMASDIVQEQPDGLHVGLCGTGSPMPDPKRVGPCTVVVAGRRVYVVDTGDGAARNLSLMGLPGGRIDGILLTHFHSDHIGGLGEMMLVRWASAGNSKPVEVYGPEGVESVVEGFNRAYGQDKTYRVAHHGEETVPPSGAGGVARSFELPEGEQARLTVLQEDGLTITAFSVDHSPVEPAVGYRFDYRGRSVLISGDTVPSANLTAVAKGVDLMIHSGLQPELVGIIQEAAARHGQRNIARIMADIPDYHSTPEDAARIAQEAGARHLVFTHIVPPIPLSYLNAAYLGDANEYYAGPITVGTDGLLFVMPAGSDEIRLQELL